jgi:hypothetical protein
MSERQSIIGFTEAELGFFLALLCLVLFVVAAAKPIEMAGEVTTEPAPEPAEPAGIVLPPDSLARLATRIAHLVARIDTLETTIDTLQGRRSRIAPACVERGLAQGPLFTVVAVDRARYALGPDTVGIAELLERTRSERAAAERAGCVHQVRIGFLPTLGAPEYDRSRRELAASFRLLTAGPVDP